MDWQEAFTLAINTRGYVVIGMNRKCRIGEVFDGLVSRLGTANHPFVVISRTDEADALAQSDLWKLSYAAHTQFKYYYRVTSD